MYLISIKKKDKENISKNFCAKIRKWTITGKVQRYCKSAGGIGSLLGKGQVA